MKTVKTKELIPGKFYYFSEDDYHIFYFDLNSYGVGRTHNLDIQEIFFVLDNKFQYSTLPNRGNNRIITFLSSNKIGCFGILEEAEFYEVI